jgi:hypothetical protein
MKATVSIVIAVSAAVAMTSLASTLADVLGGIVVLVAILVFTRALMAFAAEPGEEAQRSDWPL